VIVDSAAQTSAAVRPRMTLEGATPVVNAALDPDHVLPTWRTSTAHLGAVARNAGRGAGTTAAAGADRHSFSYGHAGANGTYFGARAARRYIQQAGTPRCAAGHRLDRSVPCIAPIRYRHRVDAGLSRDLGATGNDSLQSVPATTWPSSGVPDAAWDRPDPASCRADLRQNHYACGREVEREIVPQLPAVHIGPAALLPSANGLLTGKYQNAPPAPDGSSCPRGSAADRTTVVSDRQAAVFADARASPCGSWRSLGGAAQPRGLGYLRRYFASAGK